MSVIVLGWSAYERKSRPASSHKRNVLPAAVASTLPSARQAARSTHGSPPSRRPISLLVMAFHNRMFPSWPPVANSEVPGLHAKVVSPKVCAGIT
jgi:hypothetical protein